MLCSLSDEPLSLFRPGLRGLHLRSARPQIGIRAGVIRELSTASNKNVGGSERGG
jgi:hypothetical protein